MGRDGGAKDGQVADPRLLVLIASLAFATASPLGKLATAIPAVAVACGRTGIAAIVLALLSRATLLSSLQALTKKQRAAVALAGSLLAAHFALFLAGLAATSLAAAVALIALEPLAVVLAAFVFFKIKPTARELVGLVIATLGAFVVGSAAGAGEHRFEGDVLVLGAVVLFGGYVAAARGLKDAMPAMPYAASVYGVSSIVLLPFAIVLAMRAPTPPNDALFAVLGLALIPTLIGHTLTQLLARRARPVLVALVSPGETIGSLAIGAFLMRTPPTQREGIGALFILAGAMLAVTEKRSLTRPSADSDR